MFDSNFKEIIFVNYVIRLFLALKYILALDNWNTQPNAIDTVIRTFDQSNSST